MKKTLIVLAALAATGVYAQSSVTISGIIDAGLQYDDSITAGSRLSINRGAANRMTFSGVEDLGGGMAATFAMQMRFEPTTGTPELNGARPLFQGETRVGLRSNLGHIRLGRGLTAVQDPNYYYDPFGLAAFSHQGYVTSFYNSAETAQTALGRTTAVAGGESRVGNAVFYDSPVFGGGFDIRASYSIKDAAAAAAFRNDAYSIVASYKNGPTSAMLGYESNNAKTRYIQLAVSYETGFARWIGSYSSSRLDPSAAGFNTELSTWSVGFRAPIGATLLKAGYARTASTLAGSATGSQLAIGINYNLSKRSLIYTDIAREETLAATSAAQVSKTKFDLGITHSF